ncbi:DUF6894 family protein [Rhodoplanes sp. Z2-YC6860]|uniref:DUF6894 family protein n=1 Tax=Rhodoplanes sp. Z2-YC6860 TaxID=674703 RepID=UPI0008305241|nr:hypothetical protein [Rhodoplanes sp. Z2-YC6860]
MRYYFNIDDGELAFDEEGMEFTDFDMVKAEALQAAGDALKELENTAIWSGKTLKIWVTDQPQGGGNTLLTLLVNARLPA